MQPYHVGFTKNGIQYPANWLTKASEEERTAIGLKWVIDDRPNNSERYYNITGHRGDWTVTPKDLDGLKTEAVRACKSKAAYRLRSTDWLVVRKMESGAVVPEDITIYRAATRAYSNALEETINAADFEGIQSIKQEWPMTAAELAAESIEDES